MTINSKPILYSFRRCPYAMRARMLLHYSQIEYDIREVDLKNKPSSLITLSSKATVPVLLLPNNKVIDESLDIMRFAAAQHDPENICSADVSTEIQRLISNNDDSFVKLLRRYKYPDRYAGTNQIEIRKEVCDSFLSQYNKMLENSSYLLGKKTLADYALIPFVRQFAFVDKDWFFNSSYSNVISWLNSFLDNPEFEQVIMRKNPVWQDNIESQL